MMMASSFHPEQQHHGWFFLQSSVVDNADQDNDNDDDEDDARWQWNPFNEQLMEILIPDLLPGRSQFLETTLKMEAGEPGCYWHGLWKMMDEGGIFLVIVSCSRHWHFAVVDFSE